ncbi:MAG: type II toxin-antitoxin system PemK/MazF family toxin [Clostridiales bacterium]|nr:type II toxin-antitoxin system PemK/MazF family toxin [Clostridiales bacterium]
MNDIKRGEIFYISRGGAITGHEQFSDRPAVVVSNDMNNENSGVIEIVYLTTQPKTDLPTHATVRSTGRISTALCEQVTSVSTDRVNNYIGQCSDKEMENIDIALMISLNLDAGSKTSKKYTETIKSQEDEINGLREQLKTAKEDAAKWQQVQREQEMKKEPESVNTSEALIRAESERDTYKALYEQLFNRLVNGGAA